MKDVLEFIQQLLSTTNTERGDQDRAVIRQRLVDGFLQPLLTCTSLLMNAITEGTLQNQHICPLRGFRRRQYGGFARTQVTRKHHTLISTLQWVLHVELDRQNREYGRLSASGPDKSTPEIASGGTRRRKATLWFAAGGLPGSAPIAGD